MNTNERRYYNNIGDAKSKIRKAKQDHITSIKYMNNLIDFVEQNLKVDGLKNLRTEVMQYKKEIDKNNQNIDTLINRLDKQQEKIKTIAKLREEVDKFGTNKG